MKQADRAVVTRKADAGQQARPIRPGRELDCDLLELGVRVAGEAGHPRPERPILAIVGQHCIPGRAQQVQRRDLLQPGAHSARPPLGAPDGCHVGLKSIVPRPKAVCEPIPANRAKENNAPAAVAASADPSQTYLILPTNPDTTVSLNRKHSLWPSTSETHSDRARSRLSSGTGCGLSARQRPARLVSTLSGAGHGLVRAPRRNVVGDW
jgi:hypothetical protein